MGQYWLLVNLSKKVYICPSIFGDGIKFLELFLTPIMLLFLLENGWDSDKLMLIGDYSKTNDLVMQFTNITESLNLYEYLVRYEKKYLYYRYQMTRDEKLIRDVYYNDVFCTPKLSDYAKKFVLNRRRKEYICVDTDYSNKIKALLAYDRTEVDDEITSLWCGDEICIDTQFYDFVQI